MEMIRAGEVPGPDALPYDSAHRAVWAALAGGDRPGLARALLEVGRKTPSPLVSASVCAALQHLGERAQAAGLAAARAAAAAADDEGRQFRDLATVCAADGDPFSALPGAGLLDGGTNLALSGLVGTILQAADPRRVGQEVETLLSRHRPPGGEAPVAGYRAAATILNLLFPPRRLNVGGGERFIHPFWANADIVAPPGGGPRLRFSPQTVLPFSDASLELVYSSHCLEHLDDATVARLLQEMRRVLLPSGRLVLKLPDAEEALRQWRAGNRAWFDAPHWGLDSVAWTWSVHGVEDGLDSRFAMVFCGYWNRAMTRPGTARELLARGAFHGPPRVSGAELRRLADAGSPHALAQALRQRALAEDPDARFNHQNAWSRAELEELVRAAGFQVRSTDPAAVIAGHGDIPGIAVYRGISIYLEAEPLPAIAEEQVSPRAAIAPEVRISARNAAAWDPPDPPEVEARTLRRGMQRIYEVLWEYHAAMVQRLRPSDQPSHYLSYGYLCGRVPDDLHRAIAGVFEGRPFLFELLDCRADGLASPLNPAEVEDLRRNLRYYAPDPAQKAAINRFLADLRQPLESELQSPWRVLNVRCYDTAISFRSGPQLWHRDGFPSPIVKLLVYFSSGVEPVLGSELVDFRGRRVAVTGESGTWLLFDPNRLVHRGPAGGTGRRRIMEVTLCGDLETDTAYRFGGTNYRHPIFPPGLDLFQQPLLVETVPLLRAAVRTAQELGQLEAAARGERTG